MSSTRDQRSPTGEVGRSVADVDPNAPLLLGTAARLAFPDGAVSAATLKRQHRKGLLVIERIGGRDFTTLNAIDEMRRLCRVTPNPPVSVCVVAPDARPSTSSGTLDLRSARAAALIASQRLKKPLRAT